MMECILFHNCELNISYENYLHVCNIFFGELCDTGFEFERIV
jgi:hypothetical protein